MEQLYEKLDGIVDFKEICITQTRIIIDHAKYIIDWIDTDEFKSYKHLKYPPLINPNIPELKIENINIDLIPILWTLNIPIPRVNFILFGSHGVGNYGLQSYFERYGGKCIMQNQGDDGFVMYGNIIQDILKAKDYEFIYVALRNIPYRNAEKLFNLIPNLPALCLVRDPIESLKHFLSTNRNKYPQINLTTSLNTLKDKDRYSATIFNLNETPNCSTIPFSINFNYMCFHDNEMFSYMKNLNEKEIIFIDMKEIVGVKATQTMQKLTKKLKIKIPKLTNDFYKQRVSDYVGLCPLNIYIHPNDLERKKMGIENSIASNNEGGGALLTITTSLLPSEDNTKDVTNYFFSSLPDNLIILCNKDYDIEYFKKNFKELFKHTQNYMLECIKILQQEKQKVINKKLKESEVLKYFKENKYSKEKFKKVLENHLSLLKRNRGDIIDSWKYYNEFLKL